MALLYPTAKKKLLDGDLALDSSTIKAVLLETAYTPNSSNEFLSDVSSGSRQGTAQTLGSKTTTGGVFDAADITFPSVPTDAECDSILLYADSGAEATSPLIAVIDLTSAVTPDGNNIAVAWNASGIFAL